MSFADRRQIYEIISDYFCMTAGNDATPESVRLSMRYPDGLGYPGSDNYTEADWKRAVDQYWGIKRKPNP